MKWPNGLRLIVYLRRMARALESLAASHAQISRVLVAEHDAAHPPRRKVKTEFETMDIAAVNKAWRAERVSDMIEDDADEVANG